MKNRNLSFILFFLMLINSSFACAQVKRIKGYSRKDGYVSGHYRDTSNDGYSFNNANELGYNEKAEPVYIAPGTLELIENNQKVNENINQTMGQAIGGFIGGFIKGREGVKKRQSNEEIIDKTMLEENIRDDKIFLMDAEFSQLLNNSYLEDFYKINSSYDLTQKQKRILVLETEYRKYLRRQGRRYIPK